jgi:crossover junction endodeoxyribonuclease RuvC
VPNRPTEPTGRRVLGIDPGTRVAGWGVVEVRGNTSRLVAAGAVRLRAGSVEARLAELRSALAEVIAAHAPEVVSVERPFFGKNAASALTVGMARGIALLVAAEAGLAVHEYPPATVKKAVVGRGGASKEQVAAMIRVLLGLREAPKPADVTDALAIALAHVHRSGGPNVEARS